MSENIHEEIICDKATLDAAQHCLEYYEQQILAALKRSPSVSWVLSASERQHLESLREQRDLCRIGYNNWLKIHRAENPCPEP